MSVYEDLNRKAEALIAAAHRAADHRLAAQYSEKAKKLKAKAAELSIDDAEMPVLKARR